MLTIIQTWLQQGKFQEGCPAYTQTFKPSSGFKDNIMPYLEGSKGRWCRKEEGKGLSGRTEREEKRTAGKQGGFDVALRPSAEKVWEAPQGQSTKRKRNSKVGQQKEQPHLSPGPAVGGLFLRSSDNTL